MARNTRRLIIVVRADPVICGHSSEARNLAESALELGFTDVRILTWPIDAIRAAGLPMKPEGAILPYSSAITVERPAPVGDYKVPDGRFCTGLEGRLVELLLEGVETVVMSMYLLPHLSIVDNAVNAARATGLPVDVVTIAEAVGSDITNVVRNAVREQRFGPAILLYSMYLAQDVCVAVSEFTRELIIRSAEQVDAACGTTFAARCRERVSVSYPAIDTRSFVELDSDQVGSVLSRRGLQSEGYVLFLSRIALAKGVDDLIRGYQLSAAYGRFPLVIAGNGPARELVTAIASEDPNIRLLLDVDDEEKKVLMRGALAYVLPSKPRPEFVETFGIALAEKMLVGGLGPVITTRTGGIPEAVGDTAIEIEAGSPDAIARALDYAIYGMTHSAKQQLAQRALGHALRFDRHVVFKHLMGLIPSRRRHSGWVAAG